MHEALSAFASDARCSTPECNGAYCIFYSGLIQANSADFSAYRYILMRFYCTTHEGPIKLSTNVQVMDTLQPYSFEKAGSKHQ